jgi:hypothetical protein
VPTDGEDRSDRRRSNRPVTARVLGAVGEQPRQGKPNQSVLPGAEARGEKGGAAAVLGSTRQGRRRPEQH